MGSAAGSYQRDESMGSSVKLTYSETSTAKPTVMPNWKKNRPMMPPMKATGTNTAMIVNVVAITARPISAVASRAAVIVIRAHVHVPDDVLPHHDGVVDQQADGERESHQRQDVQREARARP